MTTPGVRMESQPPTTVFAIADPCAPHFASLLTCTYQTVLFYSKRHKSSDPRSVLDATEPQAIACKFHAVAAVSLRLTIPYSSLPRHLLLPVLHHHNPKSAASSLTRLAFLVHNLSSHYYSNTSTCTKPYAGSPPNPAATLPPVLSCPVLQPLTST